VTALAVIALKILAGGGIGFWARRRGVVGEAFGVEVSNLLLAVVAPCAILSSAATNRGQDVTAGLGTAALIAVAYFALSWGTMAPLASVLPLPRGDRRMFANLAVMPNTGFIGYPVAFELFGGPGLLCAAAIDLVYNLVAYSVGLRWLTSERRPPARELLRNPPLWAALGAVGLLFAPFTVPDAIQQALAMVGAAMTPLAMIVIGVSLAESALVELLRNSWGYLVAFLRLLAWPVAVWAALRGLGVDGLAADVAVVSLALPSGALCVIFGARYDVGYRFAVHSVVQSNVLMFATLPLILFLLGI
jgi:predicted permease